MWILPNSITKLELENTFNQLPAFHFPTRLQSLKITGGYPLPTLCAAFPPSLVKLSVAWCPVPKSFTFPAQLEELELIRNIYQSWNVLSNHLKKLSLQMDKFEWKDERWIPLLSSGVRDLTIVAHSGTPSNRDLQKLFDNINVLSTVVNVKFCCDGGEFEWHR